MTPIEPIKLTDSEFVEAQRRFSELYHGPDRMMMLPAELLRDSPQTNYTGSFVSLNQFCRDLGLPPCY